jgi:hypothetical protein
MNVTLLQCLNDEKYTFSFILLVELALFDHEVGAIIQQYIWWS